MHLAASIGRTDVVNLLLEQEGIDDTLRDAHGRTCKDVARGKEVHKAIRGASFLLGECFCCLLGPRRFEVTLDRIIQITLAFLHRITSESRTTPSFN